MLIIHVQTCGVICVSWERLEPSSRFFEGMNQLLGAGKCNFAAAEYNLAVTLASIKNGRGTGWKQAVYFFQNSEIWSFFHLWRSQRTEAAASSSKSLRWVCQPSRALPFARYPYVQDWVHVDYWECSFRTHHFGRKSNAALFRAHASTQLLGIPLTLLAKHLKLTRRNWNAPEPRVSTNTRKIHSSPGIISPTEWSTCPTFLPARCPVTTIRFKTTPLPAHPFAQVSHEYTKNKT